ncbi:MAG: MFS transporter [Caldilineaceae bacterium]|nr:MFS transporter [Caldilineaceae bacterium]
MSAEPTAEPTNVEKLSGLPWSIASNAANTVSVQFTFFGSVFILFLSELGLSKTQMGFLLSLLPFFGLVALFVAPAVTRFGYKRTYITFFGLRNVTVFFLLLTPWVLSLYGEQATTIFVGVIVAVFAMFRAVGVTGNFPWIQEYVPDSVRGKYTATSNVFTTLTGFVAVSTAGFVLGRAIGLSGYMLLFVIGAAFGFLSIALAAKIPGGAPQPITESSPKREREIRSALADRNFVRYLVGAGLITLASVPVAAFVPLFMQEEVGLSDSNVVLLQSGTLLGALMFSYVWGWMADRYGSKPVMLTGAALVSLLPVFWLAMPRNVYASLYIALGIAFFQGMANMGWGIGSARLLYVSIVPSAKKSDYMALYFAWIGITGGISQLLGGRVLDWADQLSGEFYNITLDPYIPMFVVALILPIVSIFVLRRIHVENTVSMGEFAGIFFRGNPFLAMTSMVRYHLARDEQSTVLMTERLAQSRSPLTVDELLGDITRPPL